METRIHADDLPTLRDHPVTGADGARLGKVEGFLVDGDGAVRYLEVRSGWLGTRRHAVPVTDLRRRDGRLVAPFTAREMRDAPPFRRGAVLAEAPGTEAEADDARDALFLRVPLPPPDEVRGA